ncbi:MAG: endolytic transglycosylase MltG [bacterium]|nr:endolytic transglycosylase MltG [bacterium]
MKNYVIGIVGVLVLLLLANFTYRHFTNAPLNKKTTEQFEITIPSGTGAKQIAKIMREKGLIRSEWGFLMQEYLLGAKGKLKAGIYRFSQSESGTKIISRLKAGDILPQDNKVTIPEGLTLKEIAQRLEKAGIASADDFIFDAKVEKFRDKFEFLADVPNGSLEGYLFPDTYKFFKKTPVDEVVSRMLERFDEQFKIASKETPGLGIHKLHEVVTMASIIEREVITPEDRRIVSGILWSRIGHGVAMAADATIRYALNNWDKPLTVLDLKTNSPYNSRSNAGLPPGPIGNPGLDTLKAAMDPKETDYFYYLSAPDGTTIFSKTLEEHNANVQKYLK